ncbi:MAG: methyl-accepting chemotaxis protein [Proteobacteria bacterium]|jgi:twitching motility protein PilJ|nr:methyl-accepting chemotaxis protein [Pseudomonadota bacterium]MDA1300752.1 methyl-accepting chemotaxis protein [Pseudomonadota bacterium]
MATKSNMLRKPVMVVLVVLLVALLGAFGINFYLVQEGLDRTGSYISYANKLQVIAQRIAKHAVNAATGNVAAVSALSASSDEFETTFNSLKEGNPSEGLPATSGAPGARLNQIDTLWLQTKGHVELIVGHQNTMMELRDISADMAIDFSAMQQENNKVVAALLRLSTPANEVVLAQRQAVLIERMSRSIERMLEDTSSGLADNFTRDSQSFKRTLNGFVSGNRDLLLTAVTDSEVQTSLTRMEELYRSITARVVDITARAGDVIQVRSAADSLYAGSDEFSGVLDMLINDYREAGTDGLASPVNGIVFGALALVVFLVIAVVAYRGARKSVGEAAVRNEENQAAILQLLDELADLADGDLRVQATVSESFTGAIADSINFSIDQMRALVSKINDTSAQVSTAADQTQQSVSQLSQASQKQAAEIADVSTAVDEMAVSIDMVSYNAAESSSVAERSVEIANQGAEVVQNTIDGMDKIRGQIQETAKRMKRLGESSQEIGDIVALINDIADQTNILSLNAAIQASMAGDAGKGFAVVADEVQRLAERSGAAARQISALVKTIQSDTNEAVSSMEQTTAEVVQGTRLAQDAGVALGEIEGVSKSLAEIIEIISDAARQQAASAGKISNTMKSIQEITSQTTDGTKTTVTAVGNLAEITNQLRASVTGFKLPE